MPTFDTGEVRIHYALTGARGVRMPLLTLTGPGFNGTALDVVTRELGQQRQVIVVDPRGLGRSTRARPAEYTPEALARDVIALLDHLGVARAHVAGMSLGGDVAQHVALAAPQRISSLLLVSSSPRAPGSVVASVMGALWNRSRVRSVMAPLVCPCERTEDHARYVEDCVAELVRNATRADVLAAQVRGFMRARVLDALSSVRVPTLVVVGNEDRLASIEMAHQIAGRMPRAELRVVPGVGHAMILCHVDEILRALREFMAQHDDERELYAVS